MKEARMDGERTAALIGLWSAPEPVGAELWEALADGGRRVLDAERRRALRVQVAAGELDELAFEACVFRAVYPNHNFVRFRDEDLVGFAASFVGAPFLRDHNGREIEARGGVVQASRFDEGERKFVQRVLLTVPRDIEAFLNRQMDRFSIRWYWSDPLCSVCGKQWLSAECRHWPGQRYPAGAGQPPVLCELIFVRPRGCEVSAVNVPAVEGTGIESGLAALCAAKSEIMEGQMDEGQGSVVSFQSSVVGGQSSVVGGQAAGGGGQGLAALRAEDAALLAATRDVLLENRLKGSGLPAAFCEHVRVGLGAAWTVAQLERAVEDARALWAKLEADRVVRGVGTPRDGMVSGMLTSHDQITEALTALIEGRRPGHNIRPLTGLKEAYMLLSGDWELHGIFHPERAQLAVDSSTMAGIVANAMNKAVMNEFQRYPQWWKPIVRVVNFTSLQQVKWITLGGIGELPEVSEGGAYQELTWDDQTETSDWSKRGGYLGITAEAIDRDDVDRLRSAPHAVAQAAWLSLGKAISRIFTANAGVGKTMSDGKALFHTDHGNLGTTALGTAGVLGTLKAAMRKQTELNSGERLGALTVMKYLLVPSDLENTGLVALASENMSGTANNDENPEASGDTHDARMAAARRRLIVVDLWTDTNDWAAVADPQLYPTLGLGYRYGEAPEVFSVATPSQTQGLMFTNDQLPVKVRFFFATGPTDWRGLYKMNVA